MKLWQRIFFSSFILIILAIDITMAVTLNMNFRTTVERETNRAALQNAYYAENLRSQVVYRRLKDNRLRLPADQVKELIENMVKGQTAGKDTLVVCQPDGQSIGEVKMGAAGLLTGEFKTRVVEENQMLSLIRESDSKSYILIGAPAELEAETYYIYTISDISDIYKSLEQQLRFSQLASLIFAVLIGGIQILVVNRLLNPLNRINRALRRIAGGDYTLRLPDYRSPEFSELARNINRMSASIEKNVDEVQGLADERQRFVDNFAHEMKTPLTSIMGFADLMRIQKDMGEKKRREYSGIIVEQTKRLQSLSSKMLQLSSLKHVSLDLQKTEVNRLFYDVYKTVLPLMTSRRIHLKIEPCKGEVLVDRDLFELLLSNLLDNAGKASAEGKTVRMWAEPEEGIWKFHVQDQGVGMSEDDIRHVMEPFYMVDKSRSRKSGGVGLGLSLCARIVELHRGTLEISSSPGEGTCVTVILEERKGGDIIEEME